MTTEREFSEGCRRELGERLGKPVETLAEKAARLEAEQRRDHGEGECPPGHLYVCPTAREVESSCHGGFTTCCDRPDLHVPIPDGPGAEALGVALSEAAKAEYAAQAVADGAWGSVWLHGKWDWLTKQMATEQREYAADCVARWSAKLNADDPDLDSGEPEGLRWWREAA